MWPSVRPLLLPWNSRREEKTWFRKIVLWIQRLFRKQKMERYGLILMVAHTLMEDGPFARSQTGDFMFVAIRTHLGKAMPMSISLKSMKKAMSSGPIPFLPSTARDGVAPKRPGNISGDSGRGTNMFRSIEKEIDADC